MDNDKLDVLLKSEMGLRAHAILLEMQGDYERVGDMQLLKDFGKKDEGISEFLSNEFSESASDDLAKEDGVDEDDEDELVKSLLLAKNRPAKDWWENCINKAKKFSDQPAGYCGKMWEEHMEEKGKCGCDKDLEIGAGDRDLASPDRPKLDDVKPRLVIETN
jgi:hypothetical protein